MSTCSVFTTCALVAGLSLFGATSRAADAVRSVSDDGASAPSPASVMQAAPQGSASASVAAAMPTSTYANARYGYTIAYPESLLTPGAEADDGDGRVFSAKSGTAQVAVWGRYNANDDTPAAMLHEEEDGTCTGAPASYEVSRRDLVAFSCATSENEIVYEKMVIHDETIAVVEFTYPASEQGTWAPVIKEMAGSLRIGEGPATD